MIELPPEVVADMLETLRYRLDREREALVAEMRAEAKALRRELEEGRAEIKRLRQFWREQLAAVTESRKS